MAQQRYHVIERIDAGGMAEVFKANSTSLQGFEKLVAIKRILPKLAKNERFVRMFLDEAKLSLHLSHTNCVQVFDLGLADGTYFIVMEFVDGVNLKHLIEEGVKRKQPIPVEFAAYIGLEICKGLAHAHEKTDQEGRHLAIVHRDISPPNILISREGEVKITDFGLAKAKSQVEQTDPGVVKGKFGYLSPEAAHGEHVDARTDIFAIGILLWEMLSGKRLFLGETDLDTLQQVRNNDVPRLAKYRNDVPAELERVVRKALAPIDERYESVRNLGTDLARFLFKFGRPITSFDISNWVTARKTDQAGRQRTERDKAVEEAVQQAVNNIVTLEEVDDLDRFMAEQYESLPDQGSDLEGAAGGGFDPRTWADMGFGDMNIELREQEGSDAWEEANLGEILRGSGPTPANAPGPPQVPDDRTIEVSDMGNRLREDAMRRAKEMNLSAHVPSFREEPSEPEDDLTRKVSEADQHLPFGQRPIQQVSDSVSQAMAQVQQPASAAGASGLDAAPIAMDPSQMPSARKGNSDGPSPVVYIVIAMAVLALIAIGVFVVM